MAFAWGTLIYQQGDDEAAVEVWEHALAEEGFTDARINAALILVKDIGADFADYTSAGVKADWEPILLAAAALHGDAEAGVFLEDKVGKEGADYLTTLLARLYLRQ